MEQLLIVEDDIGLNQGLCKALKADDRQIISCHDLKAAREQLLCGGVSLILLDINLPDGSGLEPVSYTHLDVYKRQGLDSHFLLRLTCVMTSLTVPRRASSLHRFDQRICFSTTGI